MNLEKEIILRQMANPKKVPLTDAERQARRRAKLKAEAKSGNMSVGSLAFTEALLDALGDILREGDQFGHVHSVLLRAATAFRCPEQARRVMQKRLLKRGRKVLQDLPWHTGQP